MQPLFVIRLQFYSNIICAISCGFRLTGRVNYLFHFFSNDVLSLSTWFIHRKSSIQAPREEWSLFDLFTDVSETECKASELLWKIRLYLRA